MRFLLACAVIGLLAAYNASPAFGADGSRTNDPPPGVEAGVATPGSSGGVTVVPGASAPGAAGESTSSGAGSGDGGGGPVGPARHPGLTYAECVDLLQHSPDRSACQLPVPGPPPAPPPPGAPPPPPVYVIDPAVLAQEARDAVTIARPRPHTSPPEDGFQLVGLETWYWLDQAAWRPVTARAELPGIWAEVTATPTTATWTPGDSGPAVTCDGPGARHPGTSGATTDCGHTYLDLGAFTITVEVTYTVTWQASNGASGTQDAITVTAQLPIDVQQRQAVID